MICQNVYIYLISNIFFAIGFVLKSLCESNILYDSLAQSNNKQKRFSKIDGRSSTLYFFFEAASCIAAGYLYKINPYIPILICLGCLMFSAFLACWFSEVPEDLTNYNEEHYVPKSSFIGLRHYMRNLRNAFRFIFSSARLKSLIFFNAFFASLIYLLLNFRKSLFIEINVNVETVGIIFAILGISSGLSSALSSRYNKRLKNKTLSTFGILYSLSILLAGIVPFGNIDHNIGINIIVIMFALQYIIKGPYQTLIKQYLTSFSNNSMRVKIFAANNILEGLISGLASIASAGLIALFSSAQSLIIIGIISFVIVLFLIKYMKNRLGLKPEEYPRRDIEFKEVV